MTHRATTTSIEPRLRAISLTTLALALVLLPLEVGAQGYQPYPPAYVVTQPSYSSGPAFRFHEDYPVVGRSVFGGGWSFGANHGAGMNAEASLGLRLESVREYGRSRLYLTPEAGFVFVHHADRVVCEHSDDNPDCVGSAGSPFAEDESDDLGHDYVNNHHFSFGMVGIRFGWGESEICDVYLMSRVLAGTLLDHGFALGSQNGLGLEFFHWMFALEVTHLWSYADELGHVQGVRISINVEAIRSLSLAAREILSGIY